MQEAHLVQTDPAEQEQLCPRRSVGRFGRGAHGNPREGKGWGAHVTDTTLT